MDTPTPHNRRHLNAHMDRMTDPLFTITIIGQCHSQPATMLCLPINFLIMLTFTGKWGRGEVQTIIHPWFHGAEAILKMQDIQGQYSKVDFMSVDS